MATIVTRSGKGTALSHAEMDSNLTNINAELTSHAHADYSPTSHVHLGEAKAWISYNQYTNTIIDSYNILSVTDHSTGSFSINFDTAMANGNYAVSTSCVGQFTNYYSSTCMPYSTTLKTTTSLRLITKYSSTSVFDSTDVHVMIFGD